MPVVALADAPAAVADDYAQLRSPTRRAAIERARGCFVVEGRLALDVLLETDRVRLRSVLAEPTRAAELALLVGDSVPVLVASREELQALTGFAFHRGVLAAADRPPPSSVDEVASSAHRLVVLEGLNDHENLGAVFRNAAALGANGVVLDPTAADPLYRRVVRVSVGNVLRVPFARAVAWPAALTQLREAGFSVVALTPRPDALALDELVRDAPARVALLLGAEGPGLSDGALAAADHRVRIPMAPGVDSLNVATAAAIALYALSRA